MISLLNVDLESELKMNQNTAAGDEDVGENRSPKSQGEEEEIAEGSRVKSDEKHVDVGESEDDEEHERDDGGSSQSGSNSDDENRGGIKNRKAESSIDSTEVGDSASIEATRNSPIDDSAVGEKITLLIEQVEVHNDISVAAPYVVQSANEDKKLSASLERTIDQSDANPANTKSEDPRECVKQEYSDTTALQYNAPRPNNHVKDSLVIQVSSCFIYESCDASITDPFELVCSHYFLGKRRPGRAVVDYSKCLQGLLHNSASRNRHELICEASWEEF